MEEKRWSRRWRDALSWFISNSNKVGISSSACLICEYAEHPTSDSSPLIKAWLGVQVAIAHLYENTWWWFYTQSSFTMEHVPAPGGSWRVHTVIIPQASVVCKNSEGQGDAIALQQRIVHYRGDGGGFRSWKDCCKHMSAFSFTQSNYFSILFMQAAGWWIKNSYLY